MNYKKWFKLIFYFLLTVLLSIIQITFIGYSSLFFSGFNFILVVLVLLISLFEFKDALFFLLTAGFFMDLFSNLSFGVFMMSLFLTAIILGVLFLTFFTNRSAYSLVSMGVLSVVIFNISVFIISSLFYLIEFNDFLLGSYFWWSFLYQLIIVSIILIIGFSVVNKLSNKFKPTFIGV